MTPTAQISNMSLAQNSPNVLAAELRSMGVTETGDECLDQFPNE